jgi:aminoglycoside phosphotransferase (APT) family kinase protein
MEHAVMTLQGMTLDGLARVPGSPFGDLELQRAWPADDHELTLEYRAGDGAIVTGRWCEGLLTLHPQGEDRRLPGLQAVLAEPGAQIVRHRAGRRAVVRTGEGYAEVVRPARAPAVVRAAERAAELTDGSPFAVPRASSWDIEQGVVRFPALAGSPLRELVGTEAAETAGLVAGAAVRALHVRPATGLTVHDAAGEVQVIARWSQLLSAHAVGGRAREVASRVAYLVPSVAARLLGQPATPAVPLHRDLHDGQVLIDETGHVAILGFESLAAGEGALDLANLLVHLELSELLGAPAVAGQVAASGVREGYALDPVTGARLDAYADAARLRLVCRYAFCPAGNVVAALLDRFSPARKGKRFVRTRALERV